MSSSGVCFDVTALVPCITLNRGKEFQRSKKRGGFLLNLYVLCLSHAPWNYLWIQEMVSKSSFIVSACFQEEMQGNHCFEVSELC